LGFGLSALGFRLWAFGIAIRTDREPLTVFLDELPRTHLNKVDRNALARWMATGLKTGGPTNRD
jgi:non-ribosomal peptide synthetase component E (peptide arylation enzyme)